MIRRLLIANRGEIAIRVARTAAALGIETVAVYTGDDETSLHIKHADNARRLPKAGVLGYLDADALISIARDTDCDAVHPGYGLLSERADFAAACANANLIFVGPDAKTLELQGDKMSARALAEQAGVPVLKGSGLLAGEADLQAFFDAHEAAPIIIKAVNGGGGRGMRIVRRADEIDIAFSEARAEALSAFGDDKLYADRFL